MSYNYQKEMERILEKLPKRGMRLLLHSCCAPCSSYCMEYLREFFRITVFYYNPNITWENEYRKRVEEEKRLIEIFNRQLESCQIQSGQPTASKQAYPIEMLEGTYDPEDFYGIARGKEACPEGGERCFACYELRLRETVKEAVKGQYDFFTTTLSISPLKNAEKLNEIGNRLAKEYGVSYLMSDFKKKNGYQRSIELSKQYDLYRQDYCGCVYSKLEREEQKK